MTNPTSLPQPSDGDLSFEDFADVQIRRSKVYQHIGWLSILVAVCTAVTQDTSGTFVALAFALGALMLHIAELSIKRINDFAVAESLAIIADHIVNLPDDERS